MDRPDLKTYGQHGSHLRRRVAARLTIFAIVAGMVTPHPASAQQAEGERLFRQRCAGCHSLNAGENRTGPHLAALMGRAAGSVEGARYSDAMSASSVIWSAETLDTFLAAPRQLVPGTRMTVSVPNAAQRAAIIEFLESQLP